MNLLENKEFLRGLLKQSDLLNTINGGTILPTTEVKKSKTGMIIIMSAPSVPAHSLKIFLDKNNLSVYSDIENNNEQSETVNIHIPLFLRKFEIPSNIDTGKIEAYFDSKKLKISMPFKDKNTLQGFIPLKSA